MILASAASSPVLVNLLLGLLGGSGVIGGLVAIVKLRPDANTAAVTQSQGAMETMAALQSELWKDREAWRTRGLAAERRVEALEAAMEAAGLRIPEERPAPEHPEDTANAG